MSKFGFFFSKKKKKLVEFTLEKKNPKNLLNFFVKKWRNLARKKKTLVRIWNDLSWEFRSRAQLCIISAHAPVL
jgi:hypothetical protein